MILNNTIELKTNKFIPKHIKERKEAFLNEAIEYITSESFIEKKIIDEMKEKNSAYIQEMLNYIKNPKALRQRADFLLSCAEMKMGEIYKGKEIIIIPWSGGRDSSSLLVLSALFFPEKKYRLITVLNGMTENIENPIIQYKRLLNEIGAKADFDVKHYFIDCVNAVKQYGLETAYEDRKKLGCPAICSSCKIIMEKAMAEIATMLNSQDIVLGYAQYQGIRNWIEQSPEQIKFMQEELSKIGINTHTPLYNVLEFPFDVMLLLASTGIRLEYQKLEMKCYAGGLNPKELDKPRLLSYLNYKNEQTSQVSANKLNIINDTPKEETPYGALISDILKLKADKHYCEGLSDG